MCEGMVKEVVAFMMIPRHQILQHLTERAGNNTVGLNIHKALVKEFYTL